MIAAYDWWLLVLGLVLGGALTWLLFVEFRRAEDDLELDEVGREALLIASELDGPARGTSPAAVAQILERHRDYLRGPAIDVVEIAEPAGKAAEAVSAPAPARGGARRRRGRAG